MKVQYLGEKKNRRVTLPVPFLSKSHCDGEVTFEGSGSIVELPDESAKNLIELEGSEFVSAEDPKSEKPARKSKKAELTGHDE